MKYFSVYAQTTATVLSDGSLDIDAEHITDNITKIFVDEWDDTSPFIQSTKEYNVEDFEKIKETHQPPEWQNDEW